MSRAISNTTIMTFTLSHSGLKQTVFSQRTRGDLESTWSSATTLTLPWKRRVHANGWNEQTLAPFAAYPKSHQERELAHYPSKPFRLPDLPDEIRNAIYRHILVLEEPIELAPLACHRPQKRRGLKRILARYREVIVPRMGLLRTSSQLCGEGSSIFYGENEFRFSAYRGWYILSSFLHTIGPRNQALLRAITVHTPRYGFAAEGLPFGGAPCFPGSELQELSLTPLSRQYRRATGHCNLFACFLHVKGVLEGAGALEEFKVVPETYYMRYRRSGCMETKQLLDAGQFGEGRLRTTLVRLCTFLSPDFGTPQYFSSRQDNRGKLRGDAWTKFAEEQGWQVQMVTCDRLSRYPVPLDEEQRVFNVC